MSLLDLEAEVRVRWAPSQVVSGESGWKAVQEQQKAGVPVRQTLLEAGYTDADVTSWGYTDDNPDGPGIDLSGMDSAPPVPGHPVPPNLQQTAAAATSPTGTPLPTAAPAPPAQTPAPPPRG